MAELEINQKPDFQDFLPIALIVTAFVFSSCGFGPGPWRPWESGLGLYNLQFVEGTKFIGTWVKPFGRVRNCPTGFTTAVCREYDKQGLEYRFYEGDYYVDSTLRYFGSYRTIEKLEIAASQDSLNIILGEFRSDNTANFIWMDRRTGLVTKEIRDVQPGPYRLGEFQNRLYSAKTGDAPSAPSLEFDEALLSSVRVWDTAGDYLVDIGTHPAFSPADGIWEDFTDSNQYSPSPYFLISEAQKVMRPINTDTLFTSSGSKMEELWGSRDAIFGLYISGGNEFVLVDSVNELNRLPLSGIAMNALNHSQISFIDSRRTIIVSHLGFPFREINLTQARFGSYVSRVDRAPDGITTWSRIATSLGGAYEFVDSVGSRRFVYVPNN